MWPSRITSDRGALLMRQNDLSTLRPNLNKVALLRLGHRPGGQVAVDVASSIHLDCLGLVGELWLVLSVSKSQDERWRLGEHQVGWAVAPSLVRTWPSTSR